MEICRKKRYTIKEREIERDTGKQLKRFIGIQRYSKADIEMSSDTAISSEAKKKICIQNIAGVQSLPVPTCGKLSDFLLEDLSRSAAP